VRFSGRHVPAPKAAVRRKRNFYETPVSAIEDSSQTPARLPQPELQQKRPRDFKKPPPRGTQAPDAGRHVIMSAPARPMRLPRKRRITRGGDFQRARAAGRRLAVGCLVFNWVETSEGARVGVITSRKIGSAVVRTRARRLLREAFRLNQHRIARPMDIVLVARQSIVEKDFAAVEGDFVTALRRADLLKPE
jgi:ribonuclease P protein component